MSNSIKIVHLTSVHKDGDVRIFHKQCVSLADAGYDVTLVIPNTLSRIENGVSIRSFIEQKRSRFFRIFRTGKKIYKEALLVNGSIYHLHDPELLRLAKKLKRQGKIVIYDAHEDLPRQVLAKNYIPKFLRKIISKMVERYENKAVAKLDGVIAATPHIRDRFLKVQKNTLDVNNFPILDELVFDVDNSQKDENEICYVGGVEVVRGIVGLVDALPQTKSKLILAGTIYGEGLKSKLENAPGWQQVEYLGFVSRKEVANIYRRSRIGIVTLHPLINYLDSLPVKMFEYMAAGIPVIASDFPLWNKILTENKCGLCVNPFDKDSIAKAINELLANPEKAKQLGQNGKKAVLEKFNWNIEKKKLIEFYEKFDKI